MNVVNLFFEYRVILEILASVALFTYWMPRRNHLAIRFGGMAIILMLAVSFWGRIFPQNNTWMVTVRHFILFFIFAGIVLLLYEIHVSDALFYVTAAFVFQHLAYKIASLLQYVVFAEYDFARYGYDVERQSLETAIRNMWLYVLFAILVYALLSIVVAVPLNHARVTETRNFSVTCMMLSMLVCVNLFQGLFVRYGLETTDELYLLLMVFNIINCFFMLTLLVQMTRKWKSEKDNDMFQHMLYQQRERMKMSKEMIELINVKYHDMNKMISSWESRGPREELAELGKEINVYGLSVKTGNEALDILLAEKSLACDQKGVRLNCMIDGSALNFMHAVDVYALFGNAMDNAMEAVLKLDDPRQRYIGIRVANQSGMLMIRIENRYKVGPVYKNGVIQTSKKDKDYHGYGIRSMEMITEKYQGSMSVNVGGELFCVCILLPPGERKKDNVCGRMSGE